MMIRMPYVSTVTYAVPGRTEPLARQVVDLTPCDVPVEIDGGVPVAYRWSPNPHSTLMEDIRVKDDLTYARLLGRYEVTREASVFRGLTVDGLDMRIECAVRTLGGLWWILDISPSQADLTYPDDLGDLATTTEMVRSAHPGAELLHDDRMADALVARDEYESRMFVMDGEVWAAGVDVVPVWRVYRDLHLQATLGGGHARSLSFPADDRVGAEAAAARLAGRSGYRDSGHRVEWTEHARLVPVHVDMALALRACAVLRTGTNEDGSESRLEPAPWLPDPGWPAPVSALAGAMTDALDRAEATRDPAVARIAIDASKAFLAALPADPPRTWVQARAFSRRSAWLLDLWDGTLSPAARERGIEPRRPRERARRDQAALAPAQSDQLT